MPDIYPTLTPLIIGASRDYTLQVPKPDGTLYTAADSPFAGTETLAATLGLGGDQPALVTPSAEWVDATVAKFKVVFNDDDTSATTTPAGEYVLKVTASDGDRTPVLFVGYVPLQQVGGTATAPKTYCSLDDLRLYFANIDGLEHPSRRAQFIRERNRARNWFDDLLQRHFRSSGYGLTFGLEIAGVGPYRSGAANKWLQDQLDDDLLMITDTIRECVAKKALAFALEYQIGNAPGGTSYQQLAALFHSEADMYLAPCIAAGIDLNADGWADIVIDLGAADSLWS